MIHSIQRQVQIKKGSKMSGTNFSAHTISQDEDRSLRVFFFVPVIHENMQSKLMWPMKIICHSSTKEYNDTLTMVLDKR